MPNLYLYKIAVAYTYQEHNWRLTYCRFVLENDDRYILYNWY